MIYGKFLLSEIFPNTFEYLKNYVPLKHPIYISKPIPDCKIIIKRGKESQPAGEGHRNKIIIYLENLLKYTSYFNIKKHDFNNEEILLKFLKYIDNMPKIQHIIIHEYEHVLQYFNYGYSIFRRCKIFPFSEAIGLYKYTGIIQNFFRFTVPPSEFHLFYLIVPNEVEARLSEWIFLKIRGYNKDTITAMDAILVLNTKCSLFKL